MPITEIRIQIAEIDEANDRFMLYVGDTGFPVSIDRFKELMAGAMQVDPIHLIRNAAIKAAMSGANPDDMASIKAVLESGVFKI